MPGGAFSDLPTPFLSNWDEQMKVRVQWRKYDMDKFDSPGGHIVVCLILLVLGVGAVTQGVDHGKEIVVFALGVLSRSMVGSSRPANPPKPPEGGE